MISSNMMKGLNINRSNVLWFFNDMKKRKVIPQEWTFSTYRIKKEKVIIYMTHKSGKFSSYRLNINDLKIKVRTNKIKNILDD